MTSNPYEKGDAISKFKIFINNLIDKINKINLY